MGMPFRKAYPDFIREVAPDDLAGPSVVGKFMVPVVIMDNFARNRATAFPLGTPFTGGLTTNPPTNTTLADTLGMARGNYDVFIMGSADGVALQYDLVRRNATDTAVIWVQRLEVYAVSQILFPMQIRLEEQERLRIVTRSPAGYVGLTQFSIWVNGPF